MSSKSIEKLNRAKIIFRILNNIYPKTPVPLKHKNIFTTTNHDPHKKKLFIEYKKVKDLIR